LLLQVVHTALIRSARRFLNVFHKETRMEKRILAVLIAALAGGAYAQSAYQGTAAPADKSTASQTAGATTNAANPAPSQGYVGSGAGVVATNPFGLCWRAGSDWTPDKAAAPCDAVPRAAVAPVPVVKAEPTPAPAPLAAAAPAPVVNEKITLSTDVLFGFNKAELTPAGQQKLDDLAKQAQGANVERVVLTGHADRIGSEDYNQELSEQRAQAVADYLQTRGVDSSRLQVAGKGESEPVTGDQCKRMGPESNKNQKLIACLQPDRRVDAELLGSREQTAGGAPASTGAAGTTGTMGSSSGSASGTINAPGSSGSSGYSGAGTSSPGSSGSSSSSESGSTTNK